MANVSPVDPAEVALSGSADLKVDPSGVPRVELWERVLPFTPPAGPPPKFAAAGVFASTTNQTRSVPMGGLYQARLYREGQGNASGEKTAAGGPLGRLAFPALKREGGRVNFLTRCAQVPMIELVPGGTFVAVSLATSVPARIRAQVGTSKPQVDAAGMPFFPPADVVASAVSDGPKLMHRLVLVDQHPEPETTAHSPLRTGQTLFFVVLAWDAAGNWDFVWNSTGLAPGTPPEPLETLKRTVEVRLRRLECLDDSDDLSDGEATFTMVVKDDATTTNLPFGWDPMPTGGTRSFPLGSATVTVNHPNASGGVTVRVEGLEDDSGSFPPDDDDLASTHGLTGAHTLDFPVGEVKEVVKDGALVFKGKTLVTGGEFAFTAELVYSVTYA